MLNKLFCHIDTLDKFNTLKVSCKSDNSSYIIGEGEETTGKPEITWDKICFIKDKKMIWTHGGFYKSTISLVYLHKDTLLNCTASNKDLEVDYGSTFESTITANTGYTLDSVTLFVGGIDMTSEYYKDGKVSIDFVTGNIKIVAIASTDSTTYSASNQISEEKNIRYLICNSIYYFRDSDKDLKDKYAWFNMANGKIYYSEVLYPEVGDELYKDDTNKVKIDIIIYG